MQKNDIFEGKVIDYTHDGLGVVKIDNLESSSKAFFIANVFFTASGNTSSLII